MAKRLPPDLEADVRRRAAAGESHREIAAWLGEAHGLEVAHTTVGRWLKHPGERSNEVERPGDIRPAPTPRPARAAPPGGEQIHDPVRAGICSGKKHQGGGICTLPAGWGTDHVGIGKCKLHGGSTPGAPPGNKNAVTTGERESILIGVLEADEQDLFRAQDTSVRALLEEEIRLITIRERRMLQRIADLKQDYDADKLVLIEKSEEESALFGDSKRSKSQNALERIRLIEDALTRVQGRKAQLIRLKHKLESDQGAEGDAGMMDQLIAAIEASSTDEPPEETPPAGEE